MMRYIGYYSAIYGPIFFGLVTAVLWLSGITAGPYAFGLMIAYSISFITVWPNRDVIRCAFFAESDSGD